MILRSPCWLSLALAFTVLLLQYGLVKGDADIESVRIHHGYEDMSGRGGDPKAKYWHESVFHPHYDGRFTDHTLPYEEQKANLSLLMQSYLSSMSDIGAETWIIHGTLLGWWWNQKVCSPNHIAISSPDSTTQIMPWDSDIDVQMTNTTVHMLASYYNMTIHTFDIGDDEKRDYMLEVNPKYTDPSYDDTLNVIDARWIDVETGLFIDITAVRPHQSKKGIICSKDQHEEKVQDLFPLRDSLFEGQAVKIPYNYARLLTQEYGNAALTKAEYSDHRFNSTSMEWEKFMTQADEDGDGVKYPDGSVEEEDGDEEEA
ncbi:hypothetical protein HO133_009173 [Letharia lupina]|uniref:LicD/FKTN/FKRP nucleotidyltransferase domain-containing protein n=1 Tax=Letharia lupina TaxID=560253 RepID=A0A8H6CMM5_9LECA|nr:uncharacterized protein HO133_009173 [Letharia lupina]KAF6226307.1 hypothetical protein HO133_009173 [Letharia lupina]